MPIRFFFGYDLSKYFGIEAGPFYFTGTGWNAALTGPLGTGSVSGRTKNVLGVNLDMLVKLPLGDRWKVFARGGGLYAQSKFELSSAGATPGITPGKSEERDFGWKAGAGVEYLASREVAVRLE